MACGDFTEAFKHVVADELGVPVESLPTNRSWGFDEWGLAPDTLGNCCAPQR